MADFAARYLSEIESGKGFGAAGKMAATGSLKDIKKTFGKESVVRAAFGGEDIVSAFIRGKLGVKGKEKKEKTPTKFGYAGVSQGISADSSIFLKIIAKESMAIPGMARDTNVLRQNLQQLVKLWGGKAATKKEVDESKKERQQDVSYFAEQDKKEAELEAQRQTPGGKSAVTPTPEKKDGKGGFLDSIMSLFADGFMSGIKKLFSPKMLGQILKKVFLPIAIIGTLFSGITDGFKKYQETGSFGEAILAGLGGMLKFLTFGLFGEDTLKSMWEAVSGFLEPITDTISSIFTGIKDFFKKIFGMGGEEDKGKDKIPKVTVQQPDPGKFAQDAAKAAGETDQKAADIGGLFGAVKSGDMQGLFNKAQEFAAKYPSQDPATDTSPTPVGGIPADQAQRNYELNKQLTGEASKALGVPLEAPAPPTPETPAAPVANAPTPTPEMSDSDKVKQLEGYIEGNKQRFAKRKADAARHIASFKKRYANDPDRVKELENDYAQTLAVEKKEMEIANDGFQSQIDTIKKSSSPSPVGGAAAPTPSGGGESGGGGSVSAGGGGGGASVSGGGGSTPSMDAGGGPSVSGSDVGSASAAVSEGQRMESAADMGSVVNAPTTNNSSSSQGNAKPPTAEAYDSDLAKVLLRA